jgi:hypothetical protein
MLISTWRRSAPLMTEIARRNGYLQGEIDIPTPEVIRYLQGVIGSEVL